MIFQQIDFYLCVDIYCYWEWVWLMILLSFLSKIMILELSRFEICWIERKWDFICDYMFMYMSINIIFEIIRQYPSVQIQRYRYEIHISYWDTDIQIWYTDQLLRYRDTDMVYRSVIEIQRYRYGIQISYWDTEIQWYRYGIQISYWDTEIQWYKYEK